MYLLLAEKSKGEKKESLQNAERCRWRQASTVVNQYATERTKSEQQAQPPVSLKVNVVLLLSRKAQARSCYFTKEFNMLSSQTNFGLFPTSPDEEMTAPFRCLPFFGITLKIARKPGRQVQPIR